MITKLVGILMIGFSQDHVRTEKRVACVAFRSGDARLIQSHRLAPGADAGEDVRGHGTMSGTAWRQALSCSQVF